MKLLVLALDGVPFELFASMRDDLPNLAELADRGGWGAMRAVDPPITVPAWASMFTGLDPGELGIYGFRHLKRGTYSGYVVTSLELRARYVWEEMGLKSVVIGLPPGYPPRRYGVWISDFYTPGTDRPWTHPPELAKEIGRYIFDITYRTSEKEKAYRELVEMTELRWRVAEALLNKYDWDIFVVHEIGTDRAHHLFQKYWDPYHPLYDPSSPFSEYIPSYYSLVDKLAGKLVDAAKRKYGEVAVLAVSDHGNQAQRGVFAINEWLIGEGLLELRREPSRGEDVEKAEVNWGRTKAWAWGGYYARIFINKAGREPQGVVGEEEYYDLVKELKRKLRSLKAPFGYIQNEVYEPAQLYRRLNGDAPDLMAYFDGVRVRPVQSLGWGTLWLEGNDRGPDDSLHSFNGVIISTELYGKRDVYALDVAGHVRRILAGR
ncbi:MAG: alkaline phosphatase family protein [Thermoproteus sp. AZ2]|uniref:Alkaline phosphatase family protein n=1 Tax=Thermoproteus sp. AZ2 TaxID=1609232 RepID=A0ACC6UYV0_9CREN